MRRLYLLLTVLFAYGAPGTGFTRREDINCDGAVDDADLLTVLFLFNVSENARATPDGKDAVVTG